MSFSKKSQPYCSLQPKNEEFPLTAYSASALPMATIWYTLRVRVTSTLWPVMVAFTEQLNKPPLAAASVTSKVISWIVIKPPNAKSESLFTALRPTWTPCLAASSAKLATSSERLAVATAAFGTSRASFAASRLCLLSSTSFCAAISAASAVARAARHAARRVSQITSGAR